MKKIKQKDGVRNLPFRPVVKFIVWFYVIVVISELIVVSLYTIHSMKKEADFVGASTKVHIEERINNTIRLLSSLTNDKMFIDPEISYIEKAVELNKYSNSFGYMMICMVDKDFNVWDENGTDANLGGRSYMQKMFATGETQVTDSLAAGADGVTLNYTIAVPIMKEGQFDGCIFAAIYFDELEERLKSNIYDDYQQLILYGSDSQVMSISGKDNYGKTYVEMMKDSFIFGTTAKQVRENMYNKTSGSNWNINNGNLEYAAYDNIAGTQWTLMCKLGFWGTLMQFIPQIFGMIVINAIVCATLVLLADRYVKSQMETVEMLITSVQELEKKIYQNERPDNVDFREIISLTSKGLTDELTGVITRTVFLNQIPIKIKGLKNGELAAVCFVDVDNLKTLNDTYGHNIGDITLKSVGYVLREYEKKYDGLVGRHGGDEFILFLSGFKSREELESSIKDLTARLHSEVFTGGVMVPIQCSIGVSICDNMNEDFEVLIKQADETMYTVKQNGKGNYSIYNK